MDLSNPLALVQKGFHIGLGATTSLLESLQDSQKRTENLSSLSLGVDELTQLWDQKGQVTEQEARKFVDTVFAQAQAGCSATSPSAATSSGAGDAAMPRMRTELEELTQQLADIRTELEQS